MTDKIKKSAAEWQKQLSPQQFEVCRLRGTEAPFSGKYTHNKATGMYHCACCGAELFESNTKYDSKSGWPSFWAPFNRNNMTSKEDASHGMIRTEITCAKCDAHLGHVFTDGPQPTGLRYCINSVSLDFKPKDGQ